MDVAVFCLALMGTDYPGFLREAARVVKPGGRLWIAEVRSRFATETGEDLAGYLCLCWMTHHLFSLAMAGTSMFVLCDSSSNQPGIGWNIYVCIG